MTCERGMKRRALIAFRKQMGALFLIEVLKHPERDHERIGRLTQFRGICEELEYEGAT